MASWLATGRWPATPVFEGFDVLERLPGDLGHPLRAWPSPVRHHLPGAPLIVVTGGVIGLLAIGVALAGWWTVGGRRAARPAAPAGPGAARRSGPVRGAPTGARWASRRDLRALFVPSPQPGRLVLGRVGRRLVATESRHSVLVLGPTQSGKTSGLAVPAILEWGGPVVATSVKGDLVDATMAWRRRCGRCWVFDPTASTPLPGQAGWSPLAEAGDWSGAQRVASWMVESTPGRSGLSDAAFWYAAAAKLLAPLLLAARAGGATMADVVRWTDSGRWDEPAAILDLAGEAEAATALAACAARDERIRSSVATTLETVLAPFEDPLVAART
ncbi:MAG TPA: type IV secretory system conjugative DNA transfer family protein, partial [Acidimicrobiales bacterium]|nr:type IV secretory system conjugative DNA transfer family protein [Acidimicrobiales bacterium]